MNFAVLGGGNFGTALAHIVAEAGHNVTMLVRDEHVAEAINTEHKNPRYLKDCPINKNVRASCNPEFLAQTKYWIIAIPCQKQEEVLAQYTQYFNDETILINTAKGIVLDKEMPLSRLIPPLFGLSLNSPRYVVLSGPSFAFEVMNCCPTALVLACEDTTLAHEICTSLSTPSFRCYSIRDVLGVELGGALKNVIAIAAGIGDGLGLGDNARAALITRGIAEMARFGTAMGASHATFMGLSGLGDLMLTCAGDLSRNRQVGLRLGRGESLTEIIASMNSVAEGVPTTKAVAKLALSLGVEMPITQMAHAVLSEELTISQALTKLMQRDLKDE